MRLLTSSIAAAGLLAVSTTAVAAPAIPADARAGSPLTAEDNAGSSTWMWIAGGLVLALVLFLILDDDSEDMPSSP